MAAALSALAMHADISAKAEAEAGARPPMRVAR